MSTEDILGVVISSLKKKLPEGLRPTKSNLLEIGKFQIGDLVRTNRWIWIANFKIEDDNPIGGGGYEPTLVVPIALDGTLLLEVAEEVVQR